VTASFCLNFLEQSMDPRHFHIAHLVPIGFRTPPVLEAIRPLVAPPEAGHTRRTQCEISPGVFLTVDWAETEDDGLHLHSVWAGPIELHRSEMLEGWAVEKCFAAAEQHAAGLMEECE
jgi:hypothetical protein